MPHQDSIAGLTLDQAEGIDPFAGAADLMPGEGFASAIASATTPEHAATKRQGPTLATPSPGPNIIAGADALNAFMHRQHHGDKREWWPLGPDGFAPYRFGPGSLYVVVAAPGRFKSALLLQWMVAAMRAKPDLRAAAYNAESSPDDLFSRMAANIAGIAYGRVLDGEAAERHPRKLQAALPILEDLAGRLTFIDAASPTVGDVAAVAEAADARLILIDYLQCLSPPSEARRDDAMKGIMAGVVGLARSGRGILAASASTRDAAQHGGGMQSGHGGAFIEHAATDLFTMDVPPQHAHDPSATPTMLRHHKARNGSFAKKPLCSTRIYCQGVYQRIKAPKGSA
jgi:hypothetical protein